MQFQPDTAYPDEGDRFQAATTTVTQIAAALNELRDQLEITTRRMDEVAAAQVNEADMGRVFVRAAQYADSTIAGAQDDAHRLVADARREAERILADARGNADAIIKEAERSTTLPPAVAVQIQAALIGLTHVNAGFITEMEFLRDSLHPLMASAKTTATAEVHSPTEIGALTAPSATTESGWQPEQPEMSEEPEVPQEEEVSEVAASVPTGVELTSLDSLLASSWHPSSAVSAPPSTHLPQSRGHERKRLRGHPG
jgi:cell division septum initiation protein DivIVA